MRLRNPQTVGLILILISAFGYAWLPIFAKWGYAAGLTPVALVSWRFICASILMVVLTLYETPASRQLPRLQLMGTGGLFAFVALTAFFSLASIPSSLYTILLYTYPALVALLAALLGERLTGRGWVALSLTVGGVVLTVPQLETLWGNPNLVGILWGLLNAALYAVYIIISQRIVARQGAMAHATRWQVLGAFCVLGVITLWQGLLIPSSWLGWVSVIGLAAVCTVLPFFTFLGGMQRLGAPRAAIISSVEPIGTLLLSVALLGESLDERQLVGGGLILASVLLLQWPMREMRRGSAPLAIQERTPQGYSNDT